MIETQLLHRNAIRFSTSRQMFLPPYIKSAFRVQTLQPTFAQRMLNAL
jgi:hypothetical protein